MKEAVSREIGGVTYLVTPLGVTEGLKVLNRITRVIAAGAKAENFIAGALESLSEADIFFLCDTFKKLTLVEVEPGKPILLKDIFEIHFTSDYAALFEWLKLCLEVNYENLFTMAGDLGKKLMTPASIPSGAASVGGSVLTTK